MRIRGLRLALVLALVAGTVASAALVTDQGGVGMRAAEAAGKSAPRLKAHGKVTGLSPGAVKTLKVRVRNRYPDKVRLGYVLTKVHDASPGCTAENLAIRRRTKSRKYIPSHRQRKVRVSVEMQESAPEACQGAQFPLNFKVRGRRQ